MNKCIIIGAGDFNEVEIIKEKDDLLIIADAGYDNYKKLKNFDINNIDILIGDFDSSDLKDNIVSENCEIIKLNPIKDETDIMDACLEGLKRGYKEFYIYGALGKRIEHSIANIGVISYLKDQNANGYLIDGNKIIRVLKNERIDFNNKYQGYISVFGMYKECNGLYIKGLKYELDNYTIKENYPIGIDNEFIGTDSYIEIKDGKVLLIYNNFIENLNKK